MCVSGHRVTLPVLCPTYGMPLGNHTGLSAECLGQRAEKLVLFPYVLHAKAWLDKKRLCQTNAISSCAKGAGSMVVGGGGRQWGEVTSGDMNRVVDSTP